MFLLVVLFLPGGIVGLFGHVVNLIKYGGRKPATTFETYAPVGSEHVPPAAATADEPVPPVTATGDPIPPK
jgi:hypothetical protein